MRSQEPSKPQLAHAAVRIFAANDRMNQMLIEHLDPAVWRARPPGKTRTIAAIFTHMHNVRTKWLRLSAPHLKVPRQLDRLRCTQRQAQAGLRESAARCAEMLEQALDGRIAQFHRDGWARPWPAGPEMLCYMLAHEAHHRGQICMLAHQFGFPLTTQVTSGMWNWEKMWKELDVPDNLGGQALPARKGNTKTSPPMNADKRRSRQKAPPLKKSRREKVSPRVFK